MRRHPDTVYGAGAPLTGLNATADYRRAALMNLSDQVGGNYRAAARWPALLMELQRRSGVIKPAGIIRLSYYRPSLIGR